MRNMDRLNSLQNEIDEMRKTLHDRENELYELKKIFNSSGQSKYPQVETSYPETVEYEYGASVADGEPRNNTIDKLPRWAIERYSRQILLSDIGVDGQQKLCNARVLIVGAGGLGCPAASYLAGAGVGEIGIVDYDTVDLTNLHRQLLHSEQDQFMNKVDSAANALRRMNSYITVTPYNMQLDSSNALEVMSRYDVVLDCSDNVPTRYLLNDACILLKIPLISGSALKMEGQLAIYGYRGSKNVNEKDPSYQGPCYRCLFPTPPPPETVGSCSANGVAGPVAGTIGCLQAVEAVKYIVGKTFKSLLVGRMLLFDADDTSFTTVRLRSRNSECASCSDRPTVTELLNYETFCKSQAKEKDMDLTLLAPEYRMKPKELYEILNNVNCKERHLLVDVRSEPEFKMCWIDGAVNYPVDKLANENHFNSFLVDIANHDQVTLICRRGNDSQVIAQKVLDKIKDCTVNIKDVKGGLHGWSKYVDNNFPVY